MKWENAPRSNNVEIDCLGKRTNIDSPDAQAALACQAELRGLRADMVDKLVGGNNGANSLADFDGSRRAIAEQHVNQTFDKDLGSFMDLMGDDSKKGFFRKVVDHVFGVDTYEGRLKMFKDGYLDVPPLKELEPKPALAKRVPADFGNPPPETGRAGPKPPPAEHPTARKPSNPNIGIQPKSNDVIKPKYH